MNFQINFPVIQKYRIMIFKINFIVIRLTTNNFYKMKHFLLNPTESYISTEFEGAYCI